MNQDWFKEVFDDDKGDDKKAQRSRTIHDNKDDDLKNQRMSSRLNQEHFKVQEEIWFQESSFKIQASKN